VPEDSFLSARVTREDCGASVGSTETGMTRSTDRAENDVLLQRGFGRRVGAVPLGVVGPAATACSV